MSAGSVAFHADKETIVLAVHNASVSGAPILGLNLASRLSRNYNVVVIMLTGGALGQELTAAGVAATKPLFGSMRDASPTLVASVLLGRVKRAYGLDLVVANSVECASIVAAGENAGIPCLSMIMNL